jgi:opacity protein-like surface antigen
MKYNMLAIAAMSAAICASAAQAEPIILDSGPQVFSFGEAGSVFDRTFDFTITQAAQFDITDLYDSGDQFRISINGVDQGLTSATVIGYSEQNFDNALRSPFFSHASYVLNAGTYRISGIAVASPYRAGGGAARLTSTITAVIPEPSTWALMLAGFGMVGYAMRRKKARVALA